MSRIDMFRACSRYIFKKMTCQKMQHFRKSQQFCLFDTVGACKVLQTNQFDKQPRNLTNISRVHCSKYGRTQSKRVLQYLELRSTLK